MEWISGVSGGVYEVTKIYYDLNGNIIKEELFSTTTYNPIESVTYVNPKK